ncbi:MAG: methyltransferase domain-containing protein, partial [Kiritimatiellae bacterium]|nr:methyltransferase domain-containing protein [Kiritimatiellia bacterium]
MRGRAMAIGRGVVPMLDLAGRTRLLDLAGGPGAYAELIVRANPGLSAVTVDLPAISNAAAEFVAADGLADRIECRHGDYHTDEYEPGAYDACTIFGALHQESPEDAVAILGRAFRALKPGGALFVLDMMTDATRANPPFSALFGLNMALTAKNGWVFSDEELKGWMREAGFEPGETRPAPPPMPHWLVSAVKP